ALLSLAVLSLDVQAVAFGAGPLQPHHTGNGCLRGAGRFGPVAGGRVAEERRPRTALVVDEEVVVPGTDPRGPPPRVRPLEAVGHGDDRVVLVLGAAGALGVVGLPRVALGVGGPPVPGGVDEVVLAPVPEHVGAF